MKNSLKKSRNIFFVALLALFPVFLNADTPPKKPICKNIEECEKLSKSLEKEIGELDKKGIENLSEDEFMQFDKLTDELLATRRAITAKMRAKTAEQEEILDKLKKISNLIDKKPK